MRRFLSLVLAFIITSASRVEAATYSYVGGDYVTLAPHSAADCAPVGGCRDFSAAQHISGEFTIDTPLRPFVGNQLVIPSSFLFSDGLNTYDSTDPAVREVVFSVTADGAGNVSVINNVSLSRWADGRLCCHAIGAAGTIDPAARTAVLGISGGGDSAIYDGYCRVLAGDSCVAASIDSFGASAFSGSLGSVAQLIPTLPPLWLLALSGMMAAMGLRLIRQHSSPR